MSLLTVEQQQIIKTWMLDNPLLTQTNGLPDDGKAAENLNLLAAPNYFVYRTSVPMSEIMTNGFDWTRVDNLSVSKARIWEWMIAADPNSQAINPSLTNVRAGINAVWVGTAADLAVRAAVYVHCYRKATVAEQLLKVSGAGTAPAQDGSGPAVIGYFAAITAIDCEAARKLP